jgi:CHAT domain-containing protein
VAAADANLDRRDELETLPRTTDEVNSVFYPETESRVPGKIPAIMLVNDGQTPGVARFTADDLQSSLNHLVQTGGDDKLIVHIASHFALTDKAETSFLLTRSGKLTLTDLSKNFKFAGVWLVTLSACDTANPQTTTAGGVGNSGGSDGRETEALGYLVGEKGAHAVLASLWAVRDESTALLMQSFYTAIQQGATKSAALQKAELDVMHAAPPLPIPEPENGPTKCTSETFAHPKFWAPFILIGDRQ